ncbi:hypothetical protein ACIA5D_36760 [Actinoplanes sp. NPDC051513]|uniref:hypothetical protein n=1 Tax=Actinoplanes sp. NPDC051513 TaxID=3363908 RepID=UPI0037946209
MLLDDTGAELAELIHGVATDPIAHVRALATHGLVDVTAVESNAVHTFGSL